VSAKACARFLYVALTPLFNIRLCSPERFALDASTLETNFKRLQQRVHPDLYASRSGTEQALSARLSTDINVAYSVLRDPVSRAQYILELHGHDAIGEAVGTHASDPALLMRVMEARELLEDRSSSPAAVEALQAEIRGAADAATADVDAAITAGDYARAAAATIALQYFSKILLEITERMERDADASAVKRPGAS
jgi:molecular chaperone HscB